MIASVEEVCLFKYWFVFIFLNTFIHLQIALTWSFRQDGRWCRPFDPQTPEHFLAQNFFCLFVLFWFVILCILGLFSNLFWVLHLLHRTKCTFNPRKSNKRRISSTWTQKRFSNWAHKKTFTNNLKHWRFGVHLRGLRTVFHKRWSEGPERHL